MRNPALFVGVSFAALALNATPVSAQVVGPPETVVPESQEDDPTDEEVRDADGTPATEQTITVTGSRIRRPNLESNEPIITVDEQYIEDRNLTNVADALNELPIYRGSVTPAGSQGTFGQGVNFVNNFGLGSNRTLTLINGRRFVSSNVPTLFNNAAQGTQVDLNVIPTILVDRIDTVAVGGAPVYGSDAISGTVNVILKTRFQGVELRGTTGITEQGDNFRYNLSGVAGMNFAGGRGNITIAGAYDDEQGVLANERGFRRENIQTLANPNLEFAGRFGGVGRNDLRVNPGVPLNDTDGDGIPDRILVRNVTIPFLSRGGIIFGGPLGQRVQFDPNGNLIPFNLGNAFPSAPGGRAPGIFRSGGDGFRFSDFGQITSDLRRTIGNAFLNYDITDGVTFFIEATYFDSRADELVQQPTFNTVLFGGGSGALNFSADNPFLTEQARQVLRENRVNSFLLSRVSLDLADTTGFGRNEIMRGVAGLRGEFELFGRDFNWEASANRGRADITNFRQDINQQNFVNAVNVTRNAAGQIVCTTNPTRPVRRNARGQIIDAGFVTRGFTPVADPNCVPLNLFGENVASRAAIDYVVEDNRAEARLDQTVFNANVGASLFDIWGAGAVGFNIGYEHRKEEGEFNPSEFEREGRGRSVAIAPVSGEFNVDEVFGEVLVPLISPDNNVPVVHRAEVFGRGRYVHNTVNGGFFAWAAGGSIAPVRDVEFRGNYTRSFRAPAITELFQPLTNTFVFVPNLCRNPTGGPVPDVRARNCAAFLARFPNALDDPSANASIPGQSGGNPNLENERANSYTFGVIVRPRFLPRFSATADYISIDLEGPIANLSVAQIVSGCFDNANFDVNDPANGNAFCSRIRRQAPGTIGTLPNGQPGDIGGFVVVDPANPAVTAGFVNGNRIKFSGIQGTLNYSTRRGDFGLPGSIDIGGDLLYVRRRLVDITGVAPSRSDGTIGDPEFSAQARMRYVEETWGFSLVANYVGEQLFSRTDRGPDFREFDKLDDFVTVNAGLFFDPTEQFRLSFSVTNLFNRQGQRFFDTLIPASITDQLGRRFAGSARVAF